jgi:hypothetical protein
MLAAATDRCGRWRTSAVWKVNRAMRLSRKPQ